VDGDCGWPEHELIIARLDSPRPRHAVSKLAVGGSFRIGRMNDPRTASATGTSPAYFLGRPRAVYVDRYRRRSPR
jgi:hypothetical protein